MMRNESAGGSLARTHENQPGLPRGRTSLPPDAVESAHRDRLIHAMIATTSEQGYAEVMIADVVRRARVSRNVFYTHFDGKESCLLAATDVGVKMMFERIEEAPRELPADAEPEDHLRVGLRAYLRFLSDEPEFASVFLVEGPAAGRRAMDRVSEAHRHFVDLNRRWYERARLVRPSWPAIPEDAFVALIGAMHELVADRTREGRTAELPQLEDTAMRLHLALFQGW